jgi:3-phosphoshikimate 1-carboxyvinyltransferase
LTNETIVISPRNTPLTGTFQVPGDKSISHRALILSALAKGTSRIEGLLESRDTLATLEILQALGVNIKGENGNYSVESVGLEGLREPEDVLMAHNSGTTARLMLGVLAGSPFFSIITGDESLRRRPMGRVVKPLQKMGSTILGREGGKRLPLAILGSPLEGTHHSLEVASAQVKSALLLAGLTAQGETVVIEPRQTRDHTERMLVARGALLEKEGNRMAIKPGKLKPMDVKVPGDFSSAAFLITASLLIPQSHITIKNVGLNPTRTAFLNMIQEMGGQVEILHQWDEGGEPIGDLEITYTPALRGIKIDPRDIPLAIDELPLLALLGTQAQGETRVEGAGELRVKESDRIAVTVSQMAAIGAEIQELPHGFVVKGPVKLQGGKTNSHGDHRMAMLLALAGLISEKGVELIGAQAVGVSYPRFFQDLGIHISPLFEKW